MIGLLYWVKPAGEIAFTAVPCYFLWVSFFIWVAVLHIPILTPRFWSCKNKIAYKIFNGVIKFEFIRWLWVYHHFDSLFKTWSLQPMYITQQQKMKTPTGDSKILSITNTFLIGRGWLVPLTVARSLSCLTPSV